MMKDEYGYVLLRLKITNYLSILYWLNTKYEIKYLEKESKDDRGREEEELTEIKDKTEEIM